MPSDSLSKRARRRAEVATASRFAGFLRSECNRANTRGMRSLVTGVLGVSCLLVNGLSTARADGDSLADGLGPREIGVGEAMRGGATGATAIDLNPSALPLTRELVFEGGYGYRVSDSASLVGVSACDSTNATPGCFFYDYAGSSPELDGMTGKRRTHVAGMTLSRPLVPRILIGAAAKYFHFDSNMTGEENASGFAFDVGTTVRLTNLVNLGVSGQNLWKTEESERFPRAVGGGLHARPLPSLSLSFDMRWKLDGDDRSMRYGGGGELFLRAGRSTGFPIRVGGVHDGGTDTSYVTAGLGLASMAWGFDVGARRAVKGGDDTLILASLRIFGPRFASPPIEGAVE